MTIGSIIRLQNASAGILAEINRLSAQLSLSQNPPLPLAMDTLIPMLKQENMHLLAFMAPDKEKGERMIGILTIYFVRLPTGLAAWAEDLLVDEPYRKWGVGRLLMERGIALAEEQCARHLSLRTNAIREEANRLYRTLGFEKKETIFYRINLPRGKKTNST